MMSVFGGHWQREECGDLQASITLACFVYLQPLLSARSQTSHHVAENLVQRLVSNVLRISRHLAPPLPQTRIRGSRTYPRAPALDTPCGLSVKSGAGMVISKGIGDLSPASCRGRTARVEGFEEAANDCLNKPPHDTSCWHGKAVQNRETSSP